MRPEGRQVVCIALALTLGACSGATRLVDGHHAYNEAIRRAADQELLLNVVRLRYLDSLEFLAFSSITSQLRFSVDLSAGATDSNNSSVTAGGSVGYSSTPTFSFAPQRGDDFARRLIDPVDIDTLVSFVSGNKDTHEVFRLMVSWMNGLDNYEGKVDDAFIEVTQALTELQLAGKAMIGVHAETLPVSPPVPAGSVSAGELLDAVKSGIGIQAVSDGSQIVFTKHQQTPVLVIAEDAKNRARLLETLKLDPDRDVFSIERGSPLSVIDGSHLLLRTRSLLHTMAFLSQGVDIPPEHLAVTSKSPELANSSAPMDDLFRVWHSKERPSDASVAVRHRDHWFYIRDTDEVTKRTFFLITQIFRFALEHDASGAPVLTLPVGS